MFANHSKPRFLLRMLAVFAVAATASFPVSAADATLRCDPAVVIEAIDGDKKQHYEAGDGGGFKDCAIALSPGAHTLDVCYIVRSTGSGGAVVMNFEWSCKSPVQVNIDAAADRFYRVKFTPGGASWRAWVVDDTDAELAENERARQQSLVKRDKSEGETTVVLQISPPNIQPSLSKVKVNGRWYYRGWGSAKTKSVNIDGVIDGFLIATIKPGDSLTLTTMRLMGGSIFVNTSFEPCGDYQGRLFENLPGGKVLYLGQLSHSGAGLGRAVSYTDNFAAAREYIDAKYPKLAGRLERTDFRLIQFPSMCTHPERAMKNTDAR